MKFSKLFTKTTKNAPAEEISINAVLLERAGFVTKSSAGVYTYLPLGLIVIEKIKNIIRKRMSEVDSQEIYMPALIDPKYLKPTGRDTLDVGYLAVDKETGQPNYILSWTHEEIITSIAEHFIASYRDLPRSVYQFQTKFRNEKRAKSGLLRGREFIMKDMYSFHASEEDLMKYYGRVSKAYSDIFSDCGLKAYVTEAGGGDFTMNTTHEFQVATEAGEDTIYYCDSCMHAWNIEVASTLKEGDQCPNCNKAELKSCKSVEAGNIFPLGTKYSDAFDLGYLDENGDKKPIYMGSYGIGVGRLMGTIVETSHDDRGIIWPASTAPFQVHLVALEGAYEQAEAIYRNLTSSGLSVIFDDRQDKTAGEKFADADLMGMPWRVIISHRSLDADSAEVKARHEPKESSRLIKISDLITELSK